MVAVVRHFNPISDREVKLLPQLLYLSHQVARLAFQPQVTTEGGVDGNDPAIPFTHGISATSSRPHGDIGFVDDNATHVVAPVSEDIVAGSQPVRDAMSVAPELRSEAFEVRRDFGDGELLGRGEDAHLLHVALLG